MSVVLIFVIVLEVVVEVITRKFFDISIPGGYGIGKTTLVAIVFLSLAYTQRRGGHIRVTMIIDKLAGRRRAIFEAVASLLGVVLFSVFTRYTLSAALAAWSVREFEPGIYDVPLYPARFILFFGCLMLGIQFLLDLIKWSIAIFRPVSGIGPAPSLWDAKATGPEGKPGTSLQQKESD